MVMGLDGNSTDKIVTSSMDGKVRIFDILQKQLISSFEILPVDSFSISMNPDGKSCACGSHSGTVSLYSSMDGSLLNSIETKGKFILSIAHVLEADFVESRWQIDCSCYQ